MEIRQFPYGQDNLAYLVSHEGEALAIDGGAVAAICTYADRQGLRITHLTHTHRHPDHTCGSAELLARTGAREVDQRNLAQAGGLCLNGVDIRVHHTPGHTRDSVVFECDGALITGDTLFNGTVGNCFSGDMATFFASLCTLMAFTPETKIYAGHDYVRDSMAFARIITPDNPHIDGYLRAYDPAHVTTTLADELNVDPYLRFDAPDIIAFLKRKGLPAGSAFERWEGMMSFG